MKNKFNIPVKSSSPYQYNLISCIDKYTSPRGQLDYTRNIVQNFIKLYFGIRLKIKRK
jgi:hypothetical protein